MGETQIFIYEVNLVIELDTFNEHKAWLFQHFHDMVIENDFDKMELFFVENTDPIDDDHMRYKKVVAQYYISNHEKLSRYLDKQALKMRSQVVEKIGGHYSVKRRVLKQAEVFQNPEKGSV